MRFGWKISNIKNDLEEEKVNIMNLEEDWVKICPENGILHAETQKEFEICVNMKSNICGIYNIFLRYSANIYKYNP